MANAITIYLKKDNPDLSLLLEELSNNDEPTNPYRGRSKSEIAGMILKVALRSECQKYCGRPKAVGE